MKYSWDHRVARAHQLAASHEDARPLLNIYARLVELQRDPARALASVSLSGGPAQDLHALRSVAAPLLGSVAAPLQVPRLFVR